MKSALTMSALIAIILLHSSPACALDQPEPGPEDGGLRLRLVITPAVQAGKEGYDVHLDLLNTSQQDITLRAGWLHESDAGDVKDYLEESLIIETSPTIAPTSMQLQIQPARRSPEPAFMLKAGEVLALSWRTEGRHLKNKVYFPAFSQNPELPLPGLYSVHAALYLDCDAHGVVLRSNEQLVSVGGSQSEPNTPLAGCWKPIPPPRPRRWHSVPGKKSRWATSSGLT